MRIGTIDLNKLRGVADKAEARRELEQALTALLDRPVRAAELA